MELHGATYIYDERMYARRPGRARAEGSESGTRRTGGVARREPPIDRGA
jgi:hypothetical protein